LFGSDPAGNSTTKAVDPGKVWFSQPTTLPGRIASACSGRPTSAANRRSIERLPSESSTRSMCWWNQIEMRGRARLIIRTAIRVSGSESGPGPE
jgi:hypothetical protein